MSDGQTARHFAFVLNPTAGRFHDNNLANRLLDLFRDQPGGNTAEVLLTSRAGHAAELALGLAENHGENLVVMACGGDGTAGEVANGIAGSKAAMGILPMGTANDFARASLSTTNLNQLLKNITRPDIRPIDIMRVDGRVCLNIASLGFDSVVQQKAAAINRRLRFLGGASYPLAIAAALLGNRTFQMNYSLDTVAQGGKQQVVKGRCDFILAAICNGRYYGGGFNPAPQASLDDGLLDVCLVDSLPLYRVLSLIPKYKNGRHLSDPAIHYWKVRGGRLTSAAGNLPGNLDGELFEKTELQFEVEAGGLRFAFY